MRAVVVGCRCWILSKAFTQNMTFIIEVKLVLVYLMSKIDNNEAADAILIEILRHFCRFDRWNKNKLTRTNLK